MIHQFYNLIIHTLASLHISFSWTWCFSCQKEKASISLFSARISNLKKQVLWCFQHNFSPRLMTVLLSESGDDCALYHIKGLHHLVSAGQIFSLCIDYVTASKIYQTLIDSFYKWKHNLNTSMSSATVEFKEKLPLAEFSVQWSLVFMPLWASNMVLPLNIS